MKYLLSWLITGMISIGFSHAQVNSFPIVYHDDIQLNFNQQSFGSEFVLLAAKDADYDYYAINLSRLADDFRKAYFLNLIYQEKIIISIDSDLNKGQLWVKASSIYSKDEVTCLLDELKEETEAASKGFTDDEKEKWMLKHKKLTSGKKS